MITLVVPVYNMEQYLPRCMESLLNQTCQDYEIVLVDDGSDASTAGMCDSYAAAYPELVRVVHKPNGGLSSARNAGIDAAKGEFVIFPDPDDWVEPHYVQSLMAHQREYQADMVCLGHYVDTADSSVPAGNREEMMLLEGAEGQRGLLLSPRMQGFSWNKLYRLDIIRDHGLRFPDGMGTTEDLYFSYRYLAYAQRVCHAPGVLCYHYCQREGSSTHSSFSREKMGTIKTYEYIIDDCSGRDPELARCAADEICTSAVNLLWMLVNSGEKDADTMIYIRKNILQTLPGYFRSRIYGGGRKVQALLALICPQLFAWIKNLVQRMKQQCQ